MVYGCTRLGWTVSKIDEVLAKLNEHSDVLARLDERAKAQSTKTKEQDERLDSHASKIRNLEHWKWGQTGAIAFIAAWLKLK